MKSRAVICITAMILFVTPAIQIRLVAQVTGSGTTNVIPQWTGSTTLGNSKLFQTGGKVGIGTTNPAASLDVIGPAGSSGTTATTVFRAIGGNGGISGSGGGLQLTSGRGGPLGPATGGTAANFLLTGGSGSVCLLVGSVGCAIYRGGNGGSIMLQPGSGGSPGGKTGNVILVPNGGRVGVGTTSPTATLYVAGNFIATGSKSALVETISYGKRQLYAMESPENWFEDFGRAQLRRGQAVVNIDPVFAETVSKEYEYHVFLTPRGDCRGLYVAIQSATFFEVRELQRGKSTITFDYRIVAKRKGYERARLAEVRQEDTQPTEVSLAEK